jgi:hypothetical protein
LDRECKMNERIQKLMEQADYNAPGGRWKEYFAELIVRECAGVVEGRSFLHDQVDPAIFAKECSRGIKRHFGLDK